MNQTTNHIDEDEIDIKEVFRTIYRYRYMIISFVLIFTIISVVFAYYKPNVYQAESTVEISNTKKMGGQEDILAMAIDGGSSNVDTEIVIVQSVSLAAKAMKKVDLTHHYYVRNALYKKQELYKRSPFQVRILSGYGTTFELEPVDETSYRLLVKDAEDENRTEWSYDAVHQYGKEVVTEHFHLNVAKTGKMDQERYSFVVLDFDKMSRKVRKNLSVSQVSKKASVLSIKYSDNMALRSAEFTNALALAYVQKNIERKTREADLKLKFITRQLKAINQNLQHSAAKLEEFKKNANTINLSAKAEQLMQKMGQQEVELAQVSIMHKMLDSLSKQIKKGKHLESISIEGLDMQSSSLAVMVKDLQDAIIKKKILRQDYTEVYPEVVKLRRTISTLKRSIIEQIENLKQSIEEKHQLLEASIKKQQDILNTFPANERTYSELQRRFMVNEKIYSYLLEKQSETEIIKASTVSKIMIIDHAYVPEKPIKPKRKLIVLVGMILGLIVGIALAFLRAFFDDRIKGEEDIVQGTIIPIFGVIPHITKGSDKIKVFISPKSAVSESYRSLRTNLQFMVKAKTKSIVIAVTSTVGEEGKTTVATNLSGIVSLSGKRTIILNLDMRKPTLHEKFGIPNKKGLSNLLSGHTTLDEVVQHTTHENLDAITSGPIPPNPSELIQSDVMIQTIETLRERYDVIVLDTPPVGLVTDARVLMHLADVTLYVLRAEYSKKEYLRNVERLRQEGIAGFGIVLNDVRLDRGGYGYGYGYYEEEK